MFDFIKKIDEIFGDTTINEDIISEMRNVEDDALKSIVAHYAYPKGNEKKELVEWLNNKPNFAEKSDLAKESIINSVDEFIKRMASKYNSTNDVGAFAGIDGKINLIIDKYSD